MEKNFLIYIFMHMHIYIYAPGPVHSNDSNACLILVDSLVVADLCGKSSDCRPTESDGFDCCFH